MKKKTISMIFFKCCNGMGKTTMMGLIISDLDELDY